MAGRFILRVLAFVVLVGLVSAGIFFGIPNNQKAYLAALQDKQARLDSLQASGKPKMVLIGGSNVAFGLNSRSLEQAFGLPVVNMATHAGLRYEYMIRQVSAYPRPGDVYLIFPEFSQMYEPLSVGTPILYQSLEVFPQGYAYCNQDGLLGPVKLRANAFVEIIQLKVKRSLGRAMGMTEKNAYQRSVFDHYGDIWTPMTLKSRYKQDDKHMEKDRGALPDEDFVRLTNDFAQMAKAKGATVLFLFPAVAEAKWDTGVGQVTQDYLKKHLALPIVNNPADYVYANDLFFDTKYHTTQHGREIRTDQTIRDLQGYLSAP
ncbi:MAG: hypothetical protein GC205_02640 [Bacteroidetes bacterium]|nr:hypothetical protein [Bacteroidota bacterium]